jgi:hypothetical protein
MDRRVVGGYLPNLVYDIIILSKKINKAIHPESSKALSSLAEEAM